MPAATPDHPTVSMDHVPRGISPNFKPPFEGPAECINQLIDAGFADRIFLSQHSEFGVSLLPDDTNEWMEKDRVRIDLPPFGVEGRELA